MATEREDRLALNEALFRTANERAAAWEERQEEGDGDSDLYYCECADPSCRQKVPLRVVDYERVRGESSHFLVAPGHETPDIETVIEEHEDWAVIEKDPETHAIVESTDPRSR